MKKTPDEQIEADRRRDEGLRTMLHTAPKPHKTLKPTNVLTEGGKPKS